MGEHYYDVSITWSRGVRANNKREALTLAQDIYKTKHYGDYGEWDIELGD